MLQEAFKAAGQQTAESVAALRGVAVSLQDSAQGVIHVLMDPQSGASDFLENRRAAGHLIDLQPIAKFFSTIMRPLAVFGDRWLLNLLFVALFGIIGYTMLVKAPRQ